MIHRFLPLFGILAAFTFSQARAALLSWDGTDLVTTGAQGGAGTWNTNVTANWWDGATNVVWPALGGTDDDALFEGTGGLVTIGTGGVTANDVTFNANGYSISGAALTLNGTTPTLTVGSGLGTTISSVIAGSAGLVKAGDGTLTLSGANTYTGVTSVNAGILKPGNGAALGAVADGTTIAAGASLDVNGQNLTTEVVTVSGTGVGGNGAIINTGAQQINAFGRLVLAGDATFGGPNRWDLRNSTPTLDMGYFTLTKTSANYLGLIGATVSNPGHLVVNQGEFSVSLATNLNGTSGNTATVSSGGVLSFYQATVAPAWTLNLNSGSILRGENGTGTQNTWAGPVFVTGEVALQADGVLAIGNTISGTANLTKTGASTLTLSGANAFSGTTTVTAGTLALNYATNDSSKLDALSPLVLSGGAVSLAGGTHAESVASTTLVANTGNSVTRASGTATIHLHTITANAGATLNIGADGVVTTDNPNSNGILGTWATVGGNQWAVNSTDGLEGPVTALTGYVQTSVILDAAASYLDAHVVVDSSPTPDAAISPRSLIFNTAAAHTLTLQGTNNLSTGGILVGSTVGSNLTTITGGDLAGPAGGNVVVNQQNTANGLTIASTLTDNGGSGLTKAGPGLLTLAAANSYTGTTSIVAGSLQINQAGAIGGSQVVTGASNNAALLLGDGLVVPSSKSITIAGSGAGGFYGALSTASGNTGTSEWQGSVTIGALTGTRIGTLGGTLLVSGNIGEATPGSQLLVRNNEGVNGTTILSGTNTFSGGLQLVVGNLRVAGPGALGTGTLSLGSGANVNAFSSDGATPRTITNPVALTGTGTITLGDATLNGKLTFPGTVDLAATARTVSTASEVEISGTLTGSGALTKAGASTLTLSADNSGYTGAVSVALGRLVVTHPAALGNAGKIVTAQNGGILELALDTAVNSHTLNLGSGGTGTVVLNRATLGAAVNQSFSGFTIGNSAMNFEAGANVTSGIPVANISSVALSAGVAGLGYAKLNPTGANLVIGSLSRGGASAGALRLGGTTTGNLITGVVSNGSNTYTVLKEDSGTWEMAGVNTYTGATTVADGTLVLSGNRTAAAGAITVGSTAGLTGVLNIKGDLPVGANDFGVGTTVAGAVGIVNHSAGKLSFTSGNALLIGRTSGGVTGTYNLSGGELQTFASNSRGVMIGVNAGAAGILINATFNLSGTGYLNNATGTLEVVRGDSTASYQNSTYTQTGGTSTNAYLVIGGGVNGAGTLNAAYGANSTAAFTVTGGTFTASAFAGLSRANSVVSTMTIGGTADVTLPAFPTARGTSSTATLYFDGGLLKPAASSTTYLGGLNNAFVKSGGVKINTNGFNITVSQKLLTDPVSTGGGLTKEGAGTLSLTGANTYTGNTNVNAGTLSLGNGTANTGLADGANVSVASGAVLNLNYSGTDTVNALWLGGLQKPAGVYGASDPSGLITGAGTLTVTTGPAASAYDTWASGFGLTGPNAAFDFDFDKDGIANGLEWILGGSPTTGSTGILPVASRNLAGDLVLTFTREEDAIAETTLKVQFGATLGSWPKEAVIGATGSGPDANGVVVSINTAASPDAVTVTIPASNAAGGVIFARLRASKP